jgi:hypothetical protein
VPKRTKALVVRETVEVIPNDRSKLDQFIEQKIVEIMSNRSDGIFEPFCQPQAIATQIRKLQTVAQQRKWTYYFEDWGCLYCHRTDRMHGSLGMCSSCHHKVAERLTLSLRRREKTDSAVSEVRDRRDLAREALSAALRKTRVRFDGIRRPR